MLIKINEISRSEIFQVHSIQETTYKEKNVHMPPEKKLYALFDGLRITGEPYYFEKVMWEIYQNPL